MKPISCDTFVCLPPNTVNNCVIFGKNSDRPSDEVQEIVYVPKQIHDKSVPERCTYIEIDQVEETYATVLSKPSWMWGAEMGANEHGVCIGNEAVWTKLNNPKEDIKRKLLGMDLVRLGLIRSTTAAHAVTVLTTLFELHGQGGPCSDSMKNWSYHNSFLIADRKEAYVLETAGPYWAAERVESGYRNISNDLSIRSKIDLMSHGLKEKAVELGFWDGITPFNFSAVFGTNSGLDDDDDGRFTEGRKLLGKYSSNKNFDENSMMKILRDGPSGICMGCDSSFVSTSSQVSVLNGDGSRDIHCFTGTPDPEHSAFKPWIFSDNVTMQNYLSGVKSPDVGKNRKHDLYIDHEKCYKMLVKTNKLKKGLMEMETGWIVLARELVEKYKKAEETGDTTEKSVIMEKFENMFDTCVEQELEFYAKCLSS